MTRTDWRQLDIRLLAVLASLLLSVLTFLFPTTPNDDAYTYIRTAELYLQEGVAAAFEHYSWATFSLLIGLTSKLGLELFPAAFLVNALFYALLVFAFISIVQEIDNSRLVLGLSALTILVYPQLNEYRYFVFRDAGFWALALLGLWQYLWFARSGSLYHAAGFCVALLLATTLRAEAIVYLVLTPLALLFDHRLAPAERRRRCFRLEGLVAGIFLFALAAAALAGINVVSLFLNFVSVYKPFLINTFNPGPTQAAAIGAALFDEHAAAYSQEYLGIFMAAGLFAILLANLFNGIGGPFLLVLLTGFIGKKASLPRPVAIPVSVYLLINIAVLLSFLFITRYLSSRYTILFCLMLALFVPVIIGNLLRQCTEHRRRLLTGIIALFFTYCAIDSYYSFGVSKDYIVDAIEWVGENGGDAALLTNNNAIAYESGKVRDYDVIDRYLSAASIRQLNLQDLLVVELNYRVAQLLTSVDVAGLLQPVTRFPHPRDETKGVAIYRRVAP